MPPKLVSRRVSPSNISLLDAVAGVEPGAVSLHAMDLDAAGYECMARFLTERGELLRILKIRPGSRFYEYGDLQGVDFATHCPNLKTLDVKRVTFNGSVFAHPVLKDLRLQESKYVGDPRITVGEAQRLRKLEFDDCHVKADTLAVAPESQLKIFQYFLDEDYAEACPNHFEILGTRLEEITINACWAYTVTTNRASQRRNKYRTFRAGRYGSVTHIYYLGSGEKLVSHYESQDG
ncbi:hypothetical protein SAMN04489712_104362 [Thermomonospora echinospora]|uniref:Leucine rich repeat-containing protein n=1 Tax=Thermomonospora echinospora TaxID=1992 RepID=A0A1H5Z4R9_9ACTN|nr:hypothetical protein [Thermomonospora echinospora]SEG31539.1 hypothetical protein SAMN04489712_104362 [Thermomonospora echinospora]